MLLTSIEDLLAIICLSCYLRATSIRRLLIRSEESLGMQTPGANELAVAQLVMNLYRL